LSHKKREVKKGETRKKKTGIIVNFLNPTGIAGGGGAATEAAEGERGRVEGIFNTIWET